MLRALINLWLGMVMLAATRRRLNPRRATPAEISGLFMPWEDIDRDVTSFVAAIKPDHHRHTGGMQP